jgi:hypothetical protein
MHVISGKRLFQFISLINRIFLVSYIDNAAHDSLTSKMPQQTLIIRIFLTAR